jgi:mannose-6-phosphate isomerase-like protein (cupin superfamily)
LTNVAAGTYRCRIQRDGYLTLEKDVTVKAGARTAAEAVLSPAPPPPPAPAAPPPPPTASPALVPGLPVTVSLVDQLADDLVKSKDPIAEHDLGCSGATSAKLIRLSKDGLPAHTHANSDEMLYFLAGSATLTVGGKDQVIGPGWLGIVPRGTTHAIVRTGNKAVLVLSIQSGPPCPNGAASGAK